MRFHIRFVIISILVLSATFNHTNSSYISGLINHDGPIISATQIDQEEFVFNGLIDLIWLQLVFESKDLDFDKKNDSITVRSYVNKATNDNRSRTLIWGYDADISINENEYELIATYEQLVTIGEMEYGRGSNDIIRSEKEGNYNVTWFIQTNQTDPSTRTKFTFDAPNLNLYNETLKNLNIESNPDLENSEIFSNEINYVEFTNPIWITSGVSDLNSTLEFISLNQFIGLILILTLSISIFYLLKRKYYGN